MSTRPRTPGHGAPAPGKLPITDLIGMKEAGAPIVMVTAYDAPSGRLADAAGVDMILVGDSAAMTVLGHDSTVPASMDEMLVLARAVRRGARRSIVWRRSTVNCSRRRAACSTTRCGARWPRRPTMSCGRFAPRCRAKRMHARARRR